ncbi:MAG: hypothetical protein H6737_13025 [Alphaproteobacteria bacterium]|nr:hypothetical protein [Alphaproteobacteria bacterium]
MAELGIVVVGPEAGALRLKHLDLPLHRVCVDPIVPLEADMPTLARESALAAFSGPDADRWRLVPSRMLADHTEMLWATSQAMSADVERVTDGWERVLVVGWAGTPALLPVLRGLGDKPVTVLLGGRVRPEDPSVRRNHTVLAEMLREGRITAAVHVPDPEPVLEVAVDAARNPAVQSYPRRKAVDIGTQMGIRPTWAIPSAEVAIHRLVHVPLGQATQLPQLVVDTAAFLALRTVFSGPPADVEGVTVRDLESLRAELPEGEVFEDFRRRITTTLDSVEFVGEEPLIEQIAHVLRPIAAEVRRIAQVADEIEQNRILRLKAFGAAGIGYTAQRLRAQLDDLGDGERRKPGLDLSALLDGDLEPTRDGVSTLAWRRTFAGVPSYIVRRSAPGWAVAREMVRERFAAFKAEFASALATAVEQRVRVASDPSSPLPRPVVQSLHDRAVRVRDALQEALVTLNGKVLGGCEIALRQDGLLRWVTEDPDELRRRLDRLAGRYAVSSELERAVTVSMTRRPLGMAEASDFEDYVREVVDAAVGLSRAATAVPSYADVLRALLADRSPEDLRKHLTTSEGMDPVLSLQKGTPAELMEWFQQTGMKVEVRSGEPCAIYWDDAAELSSPIGDLGRVGTNEHLLEDLSLPPPEGDTPQSLAALAESVVLLVTGLVVGELTVAGEEGVRALVITGAGLPPLSLLPHGAVHHLVSDAAIRANLAVRVGRRLDALPRAPDAEEALLKLVELAELGPSTRVMAQIGLDRPRYKHLLPAIRTLLEDNARRAIVSMVDHMRGEEVAALAEKPTRHAIVDVLQLSPLGVG